MVELIGALVEAVAGMVTAIAEALPAILEALVYVVMGSTTIIAYAISRQFRERKRHEWKERPKRKYLDLGISSTCLGVLALLGVWLLLLGSGSTSPHALPPSRRPSKVRNFVS